MVLALRGDDSVDDTTLRYLLKKNLALKKRRGRGSVWQGSGSARECSSKLQTRLRRLGCCSSGTRGRGRRGRRNFLAPLLSLRRSRLEILTLFFGALVPCGFMFMRQSWRFLELLQVSFVHVRFGSRRRFSVGRGEQNTLRFWEITSELFAFSSLFLVRQWSLVHASVVLDILSTHPCILQSLVRCRGLWFFWETTSFRIQCSAGCDSEYGFNVTLTIWANFPLFSVKVDFGPSGS